MASISKKSTFSTFEVALVMSDKSQLCLQPLSLKIFNMAILPPLGSRSKKRLGLPTHMILLPRFPRDTILKSVIKVALIVIVKADTPMFRFDWCLYVSVFISSKVSPSFFSRRRAVVWR